MARSSWVAQILIAAISLLAAVPAAVADGIVFASINHSASIPDQQALIHFASGVETLVIETRFIGSGSDFAWVVPLPSVPEVSAATTGLFPTIRAITEPRLVQSHGGQAGLALLIPAVLIYLGARAAKSAVATAGVGLLLVVCLYGIFLPSLGTVRGISGGASEVDVIDRRLVGSFDTVTLAGPSGRELISWLTTNGFAVPPESEPVISDYAARGWVFVASRLRRDASDGSVATPHPLCFKFKADQAVYPLRLTGVGSPRLAVDLYVFGAGRATAPGFTLRRCGEPVYTVPEDDGVRIEQGPRMIVNQTALRSLVNGAPWATKLSGFLGPSQMKSDAVILWANGGDFRAEVWSRESAAFLAADAGLALLLIVTIGLDLSAILRRRSEGKAMRGWTGIGVGAIAAGILYPLLPKVPVVSGRSPWVHAANLRAIAWSFDALVEEAIDKRHLNPTALTLEWAREEFRAAWSDVRGPRVREEDSPGNYTISRDGAGFEIRYVDNLGTEHLHRVPVPPSKS